MKPSHLYIVYSDPNGAVRGSFATAGPRYTRLGAFRSTPKGTGSFTCRGLALSGASIFVNESPTGYSVLVSDKIP